MTETRLKELQAEIARLEKLDNEITNSVNNEFENECKSDTMYNCPCNDCIEIECSLDLDLEFARESE